MEGIINQPTHKLHPWGLWSVKEPTQLCKIEDVDELAGVVTGYFAAFSNIDSDGDYITPGAFARTITEWGPKGAKRIRHLLDHNPTTRIGVIQELSEDQHGLRFVSKLFSSDHSHARNALIEYSEGGLTEHSIGFDVIGWRRDEERDAFALTELKLYEGSAVAWGANPATPTIDVKGLSEDPFLLDQMGHQTTVIKRVLTRGITDEHAMILEQKLERMERVFAEAKTMLYGEDGPLTRSEDSGGTLPIGQLFKDAFKTHFA